MMKMPFHHSFMISLVTTAEPFTDLLSCDSVAKRAAKTKTIPIKPAANSDPKATYSENGAS